MLSNTESMSELSEDPGYEASVGEGVGRSGGGRRGSGRAESA